jgi:hypothetical protein
MADTVANFLIDASANGDVRWIKGYPGNGSNSITTILRK